MEITHYEEEIFTLLRKIEARPQFALIQLKYSTSKEIQYSISYMPQSPKGINFKKFFCPTFVFGSPLQLVHHIESQVQEFKTIYSHSQN